MSENDLVIEFTLLYRGCRFPSMVVLSENNITDEGVMNIIDAIGTAIKVTCVANKLIFHPDDPFGSNLSQEEHNLLISEALEKSKGTAALI